MNVFVQCASTNVLIKANDRKARLYLALYLFFQGVAPKITICFYDRPRLRIVHVIDICIWDRILNLQDSLFKLAYIKMQLMGFPKPANNKPFFFRTRAHSLHTGLTSSTYPFDHGCTMQSKLSSSNADKSCIFP